MNLKLDSIVEELVNPQPVIAGKARTMTSRCGKPGCKCMRKTNPKKHSYNQLSYTKDKKTRTMYVKNSDLESVQKMSENYNNLRKASLDLGHQAVALTKAHGVEAACKIMADSFERVKRKSMGLKPESQVLREARVSRDKWKKKALKRQSELAEKVVRIRDVEKSRSTWKKKALGTQNILKNFQKELDSAHKKINQFNKNTDNKKN